MKIENTLINIDTVVDTVTLISIQTLAGGGEVGLCVPVDNTLCVFMALFIPAYVVDTPSSHFVFEKTVCASTFVPSVSVDTLLIGFRA